MENQKSITILAVTSNACNMDCKYCYRDESNTKVASIEDFKKYMTVLDNYFNKDVHFSIIFHGGEALLAGYEFFEKAFDFIKKLKRKVRTAIQSNLTLLDEKTIKLFKENNCGFGSSLDGDKECNDKNRKFKNNTESVYDVVSENISKLKDNNMSTGVISVLSNENTNAEEYYDFVKKSNASGFAFTPLFDYEFSGIKQSVDKVALAKFLNELFDLWIEDNDPPSFPFYKDIIHSMLGNNIQKSCVFTQNCVKSMITIDVNGDVYSCTHFLGQKEYCFGNILEQPFEDIIQSESYIQLRKVAEEISNNCCGCKYHEICYGGCLSRAVRNKEKKDYFCETFYKVFEHIEKALEKTIIS